MTPLEGGGALPAGGDGEGGLAADAGLGKGWVSICSGQVIPKTVTVMVSVPTLPKESVALSVTLKVPFEV